MNKDLKKEIMFRIYVQYFKNILKDYPDYFMFGIFTIFSLVSVSFYDVFINATDVMETNAFSLFGFIVSATLNTSWILQLLIIGFLFRTMFSGVKLARKNLSNTNWIMARFRY